MWNQSGNKFSHYENGKDLKKLPKGIYTLKYGDFGSMFLDRKQDEFVFDYKLYGQDGFPEKVIKAFNTLSANMGVMLAGIKGTGKTVQAEQICNYSGLPVILATEQYDDGKDLVHYLSNVDQDVVVFIDEYEKIFGQKDSLLSLMDGAMSGNHRRLFVLTANDAYKIADALLNRPGRLRYLKRFGNLATEVVEEIVDDLLEHKKFRSSVMEYVNNLEIVSIDIVKTIVQEVNIFNEAPEKFRKVLNITLNVSERYDIFNEFGDKLHEAVVLTCGNPFAKDTYLEFSTVFGKHSCLGCVSKGDKKTGQIITERGEKYVLRKFTRNYLV